MITINEKEDFLNTLSQKKPTARSKLRKLEKKVIDSNIKSIDDLTNWMLDNGFYNFDESIILKRISQLEKILLKMEKPDPQLLTSWALNKILSSFDISFFTRLLGNPEFSDFQMFRTHLKKLGKRRWHWRIYNFPKRIVITSELENDPLGNPENILKSINLHLREDVHIPMVKPWLGPIKHILSISKINSKETMK